MNRVCNTCHIEKDIEAFPYVRACKGGRRPKCKACVSEYHKARNLRLNPIENRPREIAKKLFQEGFKRCLECEEMKPLSEYWANNRWPNGYNPRCKTCNKEKFKVDSPDRKMGRPYARLDYDREYRSREHVKERETNARRERVARSPRIIMQITLRHGLKRRPTDNPATIDDLMRKFEEQGGKCAISGVTLTWAQGKVLPTSISLDRIDQDKGYSADNLRLVCQAVNAFRGRMSDDDMLQMAIAIVANMAPDALPYSPIWAEEEVVTQH